MMALITIMGEFNILVLEVIWHGHRLNHRFFSCLNLCVMASQTQGSNFFFFFNGKGSCFLTFGHMICIGSMAKFTGYGLVTSLFMNFCFIGMAFETGRVGSMPDGNEDCFFNGICSVWAVGTKGIRDQ